MMLEILIENASNTTNSCFDAATLERYHRYTAPLTILACFLSIIGSLLVILSYVLWRDVRRSIARAIVLCLAICDLMSASGYLMAPILFYAFSNGTDERTPIPDDPCKAQSFLTTTFVLASFFWTSYLALYFLITLVFQKTQWSKKMMIFFLTTAWTIPLVICIAATSAEWLGPSQYSTVGPWCWISDSNLYNKTSDELPQYIGLYFFMEAIAGKFWEILTYVTVLTSTLLIVICNRCKWQKVMYISCSTHTFYSMYPLFD